MEKFINQKCVFRGDRSGVFFGTLLEQEGEQVLIGNCRRLWYWEGANSLTDIANIGTTCPKNCKFTIATESMMITDCIEVLPCTEQAIKVLEGVEAWTRK